MEVKKIAMDTYMVTDSNTKAEVKWGGSKHMYSTTIKGKGAKKYRLQIITAVSSHINQTN